MINILYIIACHFVLSNTVAIYFPRLLVAAETLSRSTLHLRTKCTSPESVCAVNDRVRRTNRKIAEIQNRKHLICVHFDIYTQQNYNSSKYNRTKLLKRIKILSTRFC